MEIIQDGKRSGTCHLERTCPIRHDLVLVVEREELFQHYIDFDYGLLAAMPLFWPTIYVGLEYVAI